MWVHPQTRPRSARPIAATPASAVAPDQRPRGRTGALGRSFHSRGNRHDRGFTCGARGSVAAGSSGIWRRNASGSWSRSLLLLPQGLLSGSPHVTALAAFDQPLSLSIYLATDGYGVLISQDGGYSWIRDDLGLPDDVLGLVTNAKMRSLFAETGSGLWVHYLSTFPNPPSYVSGDLLWRWLAIIGVALASVGAGSIFLRRACQ